MYRYFIVYKPYQVLCQFTSEGAKKCLADFFNVPKNVYSVGRLDYDSEGLLILTNDPGLNHLLLNPKHQHEREYWVQVEGLVTQQAVDKLQSGVTISVDGKLYTTRTCRCEALKYEPVVYERDPPIRFRKEIPVSWISLTLTEGKNRQVRRMTAKVGHPTLRLIRYRIEKLDLDGLKPGEMRELSSLDLYRKLKI